MFKLQALLFVALASIGVVGCTDDASTSQYRNALTGAVCVPDPETLVPLHGHNGQGNGNGGHNSPTGIPGDNIDDPNSGKVDCLGDGDSGQGNDERNCTPAPGCDAEDCCEEPPPSDPSDPPPSDPPPSDPPPSEPPPSEPTPIF